MYTQDYFAVRFLVDLVSATGGQFYTTYITSWLKSGLALGQFYDASTVRSAAKSIKTKHEFLLHTQGLAPEAMKKKNRPVRHPQHPPRPRATKDRPRNGDEIITTPYTAEPRRVKPPSLQTVREPP